MALESHITITTTVTPTPPAPPTRQNVVCFVGVHTVIEDTAAVYTSLDEMEDDGWDDGDVLYNMVAAALAQESTGRQITKWFIGKRETPVASVWTFNVVGTTDGAMNILEGDTVIATFTAAGSTATQIKDGLVAATIAGYTAASVDTDTFTVTKGEVGIPMTLTIGGAAAANLTGSETTPAVGIFDDLDAISAATVDGKTVGAQVEGFVVAPGLGQLGLIEGARWAHTDGLHIVHMQSNDADIPDNGQTDDGASRIKALGYTRSEVCYRSSLTDYVQSMMVGHVYAKAPGSSKVAWWTMVGSTQTTTTTATQDNTFRTKRASWTDFVDVDGKVTYFGGRDGTGDPIYWYLARDHWYDRIKARVVFEARTRQAIDMTDDGIQVGYVAGIRAEMDAMITAGTLAEGYTITATPMADVPAGEVQAGNFQTTGKITVAGFLRIFNERIAVAGEFSIPTTA